MNSKICLHFTLSKIININFYLGIIYSFLFKFTFKKTGKKFRFDAKSSSILTPYNIEIGDNVFIGRNAHVSVQKKLTIGDGVMIGPNVTIIGGDHNISVTGKMMHEVKSGGINLPITIERDVWIGANVTILKGVNIGEGSVVGAGSVVTRSIPKYTIVAGNPAKVIKNRFQN